MAGNPKTSKSTAPAKKNIPASTKGVKVGVNGNAKAQSTAVMKKGGMVKRGKC